MPDVWTLYEERSPSMCVEATFDFIRYHGGVWLRLGAILLLPVCVLLSLHVFVLDNEVFANDVSWDSGLFWSDTDRPLVYCSLLAAGLWGSLTLVYTLVCARQEEALTNSLRPLVPYMRQVVWRTLVSALMLFVLLWVLFGLRSLVIAALTVILLVPVLLVPPSWILERTSRATAVSSALRLGFTSWFSLFFVVLIVSLVGFVIILVVDVPWIVAQTVFTELIPVDERIGGGLLFLKSTLFLFTVLAYFCCFMMVSLVLLSCVFHYGSVSEKVDDTSLEYDIDHFEQL